MAKALSDMTDEELEQYGFELGDKRAADEAKWREQQLLQQAEVTRRSDARGGAAKETSDGE